MVRWNGFAFELSLYIAFMSVFRFESIPARINLASASTWLAMPAQIRGYRSLKLALGTAQFGMAYGITNRSGAVPLHEARAILSLAASGGVDLLDTAVAYGESEAVLGILEDECCDFRIVTKLPSLSDVDCIDNSIDLWRSNFFSSLKKLRRERLDILLVHSASDLLSRDGDRLWRLLKSFKDAGQAVKIGASVYESEEGFELLKRYDIEVCQLPFNALDDRVKESGLLASLKKNNVEVHARSVFLQGLLLARPEEVPPQLSNLKLILNAWQELLYEKQITRLEGALLAVRQCQAIDCLIFGVTCKVELLEVLKAWHSIESTPPINLEGFEIRNKSILDPRSWLNQWPSTIITPAL